MIYDFKKNNQKKVGNTEHQNRNDTRKKYFSQKITYPGYFLKENARLRLAPRNWKKTPETSYHSSCYSNKLHTKGDFT